MSDRKMTMPKKGKPARSASNHEKGLIWLLGGGLALIAAVWIFAFQLGDSLARLHIKHRVEGVAQQVMEVLAETGSRPAGALSAAADRELRSLIKYREVENLRIADGAGRVVWSSSGSKEERIQSGGEKTSVKLRKTAEGELSRTMAQAVIAMKGALVAMDMDMTGLLAWYQRIIFAIAKVVTTVIVGGFLVIGAILFGKWREEREAETALSALRREKAEEHERVLVLQAQLEKLNADMAALTRRLGEAMRDKSNGGRENRPAGKSRKTG